MSIIFPALGVAFVAFCVWLGVRIFNRRERWAKRTAVGLVFVVLAGYPLSFGPACRLFAIPKIDDSFSEYKRFRWLRMYSPLIWAASRPSPVFDLLERYATLWMPKGTVVAIPKFNDGNSFSIIGGD